MVKVRQPQAVAEIIMATAKRNQHYILKFFLLRFSHSDNGKTIYYLITLPNRLRRRDGR